MSDIEIFAQTNVGKIRKGNEDSFLVFKTTSENLDALPETQKCSLDEKNNFFMVADGMGGPAAGEVASLLAVNTVLKERNYRTPSTESEFVETLKELLKKANAAILDKSRHTPEMNGMGTTATLAGILNKKLYMGQVGDSRGYIIRDNYITQITKDQSYVNQLIETGAITEKEAENHPRKNVILQALGAQELLNVAITSIDLCRNDYLLLCSDGLSGLVKNEEMKSIIKSSSDLKSACGKMIELANQRGGIDNITVIVVSFPDETLPTSSNSATVKRKIISEYKPHFSK